ncbi:MAG: ribbon-helix-helix protein, CopG family [Dehalococcoidia bacterium]
MTMIRKQIYLTQELDEKVKGLARARNVPEAEIIRAALEQYGEYRTGSAERDTAVRETATMQYGASTMNRDEDRERIIRRINAELDRNAGLRVLEIARERAERLGSEDKTAGGRSWSREDLYDERPKYLSR